jgi:hypothetical protein
MIALGGPMRVPPVDKIPLTDRPLTNERDFLGVFLWLRMSGFHHRGRERREEKAGYSFAAAI